VGNRLEWAVVGLGLNVNLDFDAAGLEALAGQATSLSRELGHRVDRVRLLQALLMRAETYLAAVYGGASFHGAWNERLDLLGQAVAVATPAGRISGTAMGVDERGRLRLKQADDTTIEISVGEVEHVLRG
jgi:BirA family biotin operon repressor/biotin-[acetyl-CoA-carboxylase] ligase